MLSRSSCGLARGLRGEPGQRGRPSSTRLCLAPISLGIQSCGPAVHCLNCKCIYLLWGVFQPLFCRCNKPPPDKKQLWGERVHFSSQFKVSPLFQGRKDRDLKHVMSVRIRGRMPACLAAGALLPLHTVHHPLSTRRPAPQVCSQASLL